MARDRIAARRGAGGRWVAAWATLAWAALCAGGLAGCSDFGSPIPTGPPAGDVCSIEPSRLDLGRVVVGQAVEGSFRIVNRGTVDLDADVTGSCADLAIVSGGGAAVIAPGDTLEVTVRCTPSAAGPFNCTLPTGLPCAEVAVVANAVAPATVSFAADVQPIFTANCVVCHGPAVQNAGMNLGAAASYANLVGVVSTGYAPALRVAAGDTTASVLYHKVFGTGQYGATMPLGGSLPQHERDLIRTWITEGAQDN